MVVSAGQVVGTERRHNEALVMFFLRHRRADRYGPDIAPGHPLYERIRQEVLAQERSRRPSKAEVLASLNAKLDRMAERRKAADRLLEGDGEQEQRAPAIRAWGRGWPRPQRRVMMIEAPSIP